MSTKSGRIGLLMFVVLGLMISHYNRELRCFEVELEDREEVISSLETDKENLTKELEQTQRELMISREKIKKASRGSSNRDEFIVTAYDLSYESCQKNPDDEYYGITATGVDLKGEDWKSARLVAVDPKVISLGSRVKIEFIDDEYRKYDGVYIAGDVGGAIKGKRLDLFYGEDVSRGEVMAFGKTKAKVEVLE